MKKLMLLIVACLMSIAFASQSFAGPMAVADSGTGGDQFRIEIWTSDMATLIFSDYNVPPDVSGTYLFYYDLGPANIPNGSYVARTMACNMWGCSDWGVPYPFDPSIPSGPLNTRIIRE